MPEAILHLSSLVGSPLLDSAGDRLGRVDDVVARLDSGDGVPPPVVGLEARIGGRHLFVPANRIERLEPNGAHTSTTKLNLAQFERRSGEVLLRADVLDRSLIEVEQARLVKAREVDLYREESTWRVAGIDPHFRARLRRLLPRRFRHPLGEHERVVAQASARDSSLLILTDIFYPGWKAFVDGRPAPIRRVDYLLRGVALPPGSHRVEFRYQPASFRAGWIISLLGLLVTVAAAVIGWRTHRRAPQRTLIA